MRAVVAFLLFALMLDCFCAQQSLPTRRRAFQASAAGGCNTVSGALKFETYEGTGYSLAGWTEFGVSGDAVCDEDYTGTVIAGAQSLRIKAPSGTGTTGTRLNLGGAQSTLYFFCKFRRVTIGAQIRVFVFENGGGAENFAVNINSSGTVLVYNGTTASSATVGTISAGVTYYIWGQFTKGSGADGISRVGFSTDGTRPTSGNNFQEVTAGNATTDVTDVVVKITDNGAGNAELIFDTAIWKTTQIDDNPCD